MNGSKQTVLITGASRGIGRELVERYRETGARVFATARKVPEGETTDEVEWIASDLSTAKGCDDLINAIAQSGARLDVLINNAGIQQALDLTGERDVAAEMEREIRLNLIAPMRLSAAVLPYMTRSGGVIANVTSLVSRHPKASAPAYSASKAGLASFTRSLRHQLEPLGITVVEIVPPLVETDMTKGRGRNKLTAKRMAEAIVAGIERRTNCVAPQMSRTVLAINRVVPELVERMLRSS